MKQGIFTVTGNSPLNARYARLALSGDTSGISAPGQFVELSLPGFFLRRPFSVCDWDSSSLTLVYESVGKGTRALRELPAGTRLDLLTGLGKGFDLAISTMSPAIHDAATVKKMSAMTRGWCFLARFYDWEQPWRDQLMRELGMKPRKAFGDLEGDVSSMIQAVRDAGHAPQVKYVDYNWADPRTPEQMADYMGRTYFTEDENRDALTRETLRLAKQHANAEGKVIDNVNTKVAWIWWKTEEQA